MDSLQDGANRRLQFRLSSTRTDRDDKSILYQFIRGGDKYEIAFAVSQTKGVDQRVINAAEPRFMSLPH